MSIPNDQRVIDLIITIGKTRAMLANYPGLMSHQAAIEQIDHALAAFASPFPVQATCINCRQPYEEPHDCSDENRRHFVGSLDLGYGDPTRDAPPLTDADAPDARFRSGYDIGWDAGNTAGYSDGFKDGLALSNDGQGNYGHRA